MDKEEIKKVLAANRKILRKYKVSKVGIFGSYVLPQLEMECSAV